MSYLCIGRATRFVRPLSVVKSRCGCGLAGCTAREGAHESTSAIMITRAMPHGIGQAVWGARRARYSVHTEGRGYTERRQAACYNALCIAAGEGTRPAKSCAQRGLSGWWSVRAEGEDIHAYIRVLSSVEKRTCGCSAGEGAHESTRAMPRGMWQAVWGLWRGVVCWVHVRACPYMRASGAAVVWITRRKGEEEAYHADREDHMA